MRVYFDTSSLLKVYVLEARSPAVLEILQTEKTPIPFTQLVELEMRTAIRLKHGRAEITASQMRAVLQTIERDLAGGVLVRPPCDLDSIFRHAETLSAKHAASTLARSADLWHVAAALEIGCPAFPRSMSAKEKSRRFANSKSSRPDPPRHLEISTLQAATGAAGSRPAKGCEPPSGVRPARWRALAATTDGIPAAP
ncbi:MAG: type II toxin-antitoxin system VapC family toxin [Bdellovibrionaceae bacterium]|nr:type II toxin-antitoxin system VapC family toxin [Pseudobdellovibrionaceae bacterium]